jgi:hypothetical protein
VGLVRGCHPSLLLKKTRMKTKKMRKLRFVLAGRPEWLNPARDKAYQQVG